MCPRPEAAALIGLIWCRFSPPTGRVFATPDRPMASLGSRGSAGQDGAAQSTDPVRLVCAPTTPTSAPTSTSPDLPAGAQHQAAEPPQHHPRRNRAQPRRNGLGGRRPGPAGRGRGRAPADGTGAGPDPPPNSPSRQHPPIERSVFGRRAGAGAGPLGGRCRRRSAGPVGRRSPRRPVRVFTIGAMNRRKR